MKLTIIIPDADGTRLMALALAATAERRAITAPSTLAAEFVLTCIRGPATIRADVAPPLQSEDVATSDSQELMRAQAQLRAKRIANVLDPDTGRATVVATRSNDLDETPDIVQNMIRRKDSA